MYKCCILSGLQETIVTKTSKQLNQQKLKAGSLLCINTLQVLYTSGLWETIVTKMSKQTNKLKAVHCCVVSYCVVYVYVHCCVVVVHAYVCMHM